MSEVNGLEERAINTIRFLSADAIEKANSGHPGLPMGAAAMAYTIWTRHLKANPANPKWVNRDRFVLSGGHGSMLLYSLLHLFGYGVSLDDIKNFRQWGSITPGHPELGMTPGVETTTGPLGQGFANGVGMAIAEAHLAARFNQGEHKIFDHYIYAIVTDGDLMEGVASEAASLAGHLKLGRLIYLYDNNHISIDGSTDLAFTEDRTARFSAYGWHVDSVEDGNDVESIDKAIQAAKADPRPSLIAVKTIIGYGLPTRAGTSKAHGEPPGAEELAGAKAALGWPAEPDFYIPDDVLEFYRNKGKAGATFEAEWNKKFDAYMAEFPKEGAELESALNGEINVDWEAVLPVFEEDSKGMATRAASGKVLNAIAEVLPALMGGSADLQPSNKTWINGSPAFQPETPEGRNMHFGVREHGMGAIVNGMSLYPGIIPYGGTFLVFSDYMRGAVRVSAFSHMGSIWVYTHDSIGLGEDGPTHQPVEHLAALRAMPNLSVIRPGDANEVAAAWKVAVSRRDGPTALVFSRQGTPTISREKYASAFGLEKGAYVLADLGGGKPQVILIGTGTELDLAVKAGEQLAAKGVSVRLVSFPSWDLFEKQSDAYKASVFPPEITARVSVEAGVSMGWERYVGPKGKSISVNKFGASAPYKIIYEKYGITVEAVVDAAKSLIK